MGNEAYKGILAFGLAVGIVTMVSPRLAGALMGVIAIAVAMQNA